MDIQSAQTRLDEERKIVEAAAELSPEDLTNLGKFALHPAWEELAPTACGYFAGLAAVGLRDDSDTQTVVRLKLETWSHKDVACGIVAGVGLLDTAISPTMVQFAVQWLKTLTCENVVRVRSAPLIAALN